MTITVAMVAVIVVWHSGYNSHSMISTRYNNSYRELKPLNGRVKKMYKKEKKKKRRIVFSTVMTLIVIQIPWKRIFHSLLDLRNKIFNGQPII